MVNSSSRLSFPFKLQTHAQNNPRSNQVQKEASYPNLTPSSCSSFIFLHFLPSG
jgi:hypothetical protein